MNKCNEDPVVEEALQDKNKEKRISYNLTKCIIHSISSTKNV